ncbi:MAG: porphobilinogen synthase [Planctomycetota bacterium]|nr:porphobilinogen synthase [Planctomycetota bacterium]MDA1177804.1 porphobilinogen synthase [Planctomycetota bacterium]
MADPNGIFAGRFPSTRLRRSRRYEWSRNLAQEHRLSKHDLIWPLFVHDQSTAEPIASMPGIFRWPIADVVRQAQEACSLGIPAIAIFPATPPSHKTDDAREALNPENLVCRCVRAVKKAVGDQLGVICDVALDPYSSHGHDGLVRNGDVANDETVVVLCQQAVVQATAGCDIIAPSDMMDGRVGAIRQALDAHGFQHVMILAYAAKYASAFYGPFRDAVGSAHSLGSANKNSYQMNPANGLESLREVILDIDEGADWVMVKPGLPYLDIVYRVKASLGVPTFVYQVSGEYSMVAFAAQHGLIDRRRGALESLLAMKRAGADGILTYFAPEVANWLAEA